jgi:DNA-binding MarR family transcriptional regulator
MVALVDELESRGLVERERSTADRRQYALQLTSDGHSVLRGVATLARAHDRDLGQALDADERETLAHLLTRIAEQQGLAPGIHPGYTSMT